jgi:Zn-dependent protease with chaperone function
MKVTFFLLVLAMLSGCATHPITGRTQILALPAVQSAYADADYALSATARRISVWSPCEPDCGSTLGEASLALRAAAIGAELNAAAREISPDLPGRIDRFEIEVDDALGVGTGSSAGGRIVLGSGLAGLEPTNTVIAFLIAREMAHVIARHAEENSGASMLFSVLGFLLPGFNVVARFVATTLGSGALKSSWAAEQQREADTIAVLILQRAGLPAPVVAEALERGIARDRLSDDEWGARYLESAQRVAKIAASPLVGGSVYFANDMLK